MFQGCYRRPVRSGQPATTVVESRVYRAVPGRGARSGTSLSVVRTRARIAQHPELYEDLTGARYGAPRYPSRIYEAHRASRNARGQFRARTSVHHRLGTRTLAFAGRGAHARHYAGIKPAVAERGRCASMATSYPVYLPMLPFFLAIGGLLSSGRIPGLNTQGVI